VFFTGKHWLCAGCWSEEFPSLPTPGGRP